MTDKQDDIATYFFLDKQIAETYKRIRHFEKMFNSSNFYTCIQERYGDVTTVAFDIEREVIRHISAIEHATKHIAILEFKEKHFKRFLRGIPSQDRYYLTERYKYNQELINDEMDRVTLDEIKEIEQAARYHFEEETMERVLEETEDDPQKHLEMMLEMLGG